MSRPDPPVASRLRLHRMGIDTYQEPVLYMHRDCHVCVSEGFEVQSRVEILLNGRSIVATLNVVEGDLLPDSVAGLSESAWRLLQASDGDLAGLRHPAPLESLGHVRAKVYGRRLTACWAGRRRHGDAGTSRPGWTTS